jgi:RNA polymerase sigma-70 factor, ECF subfamily
VSNLLDALVPTTVAHRDELSALLGELWDRARAAHPGVVDDAASFADRLRVALTGEPFERWPERLARMPVEDLWLAAAAERGDRQALERVNAAVTDIAGVVARRFALDPSELAQLVRVRVLSPIDGSRPKIQQYLGKGTLSAWLRVVTARIALNQRGRTPPHEGIGERVATTDPEAIVLRRQLQDVFASALQAAFAALPAEERRLLREYFVEGATVVELGTRHGVHTATAARRINHAKHRLLETFRGHAATRLSGSSLDVGAMLEVLRSQLSLPDGRLLVSVA